MLSHGIEGYIYAIQARALRVIKIGYASNPANRLKSLQTGSPDLLNMIGLWRGVLQDEIDLHLEFGKLRVHGEWFQETPELLKRIQELNDMALLKECRAQKTSIRKRLYSYTR